MNNNNEKKTWQKPEVKDLDVKETKSGHNDFTIEYVGSSGNYAPS